MVGPLEDELAADAGHVGDLVAAGGRGTRHQHVVGRVDAELPGAWRRRSGRCPRRLRSSLGSPLIGLSASLGPVGRPPHAGSLDDTLDERRRRPQRNGGTRVRRLRRCDPSGLRTEARRARHRARERHARRRTRQRAAGPDSTRHAQSPRPHRGRDGHRQDQDAPDHGRPAVAGRCPGLRRRHQGRRDGHGRTRRRVEPEDPGTLRVDGVRLPGPRPPRRVPVAVRRPRRPGAGVGPLVRARSSSARSSTSTRPRPRSSR